jgi:hypothetical protein
MRRGAAENRTRIGVDAAENELRRPPPMSSGGLQPIRTQVRSVFASSRIFLSELV